jgi:hypothetical protein
MRTEHPAQIAETATVNAYGVFSLEIARGWYCASYRRMNVDLAALDALREQVIGCAIAVIGNSERGCWSPSIGIAW